MGTTIRQKALPASAPPVHRPNTIKGAFFPPRRGGGFFAPDATIQRQPAPGPSDLSWQLPDTPLRLHEDQIDYAGLRGTLLARDIPLMDDREDVLKLWTSNFEFFRLLGMTPERSVSLSNITTPLALDSIVKTGRPTLFERSDQALHTTTRSLSIPVLEFDANFSPRPASWLRHLFHRK